VVEAGATEMSEGGLVFVSPYLAEIQVFLEIRLFDSGTLRISCLSFRYSTVFCFGLEFITPLPA